MALTNYGTSKPVETKTVRKVWNIIKGVKLSLEYFIAMMVIATFLLHITRADVPILWYVIFLLLVLGFFFEKFKGLIIKDKEDVGDRHNTVPPRDGTE